MNVPDVPPVLSDRYAIERLLGRGGMAAVYLATDRRHGRQVAVKVLDAELTQSVSGERFLREIRIAAGLTHPHILPLHDSGRDAGFFYYVMPFVAGETLRARLDRERQLPLDEAVRITCEVAGALEHAHRHHVLHRDIKPDNILLEDGHAVVADFGIARALDASTDTRMTATGVAIGTPTYMSPEQAGGEAVDARSDIYSLACVLYEMLAGEPPFTGPTTAAVLAKRMVDPPPRIRTVRPAVPLSLERVLLRALDRVPADRYASAADFRRALEACAHAAPEEAPRFGSRRMRIGAALTLAIALGAATWMARDRLAGGDAFTTVAVLPLVNGSTDPEHAFLAEGLTDALIGDLGTAPGLRVVSRMSAARYGSMPDMPAGAMSMPAGGMSFMDDGNEAAASMRRPTSLSAIAQELGADVLLQGTLVRNGDSVNVQATLVRAPSLEPLWQASFTRHARELFGLQRELAQAIVGAVARGRSRARYLAEASAPRSYVPEAHEAYLKGSYFQMHWKLEQAVAAFEQAIALDPSHAPAQAGLARAWYFRAFFGDVAPGIALGRMRRAATAALEQDSMIAEAHAQLALVKMLQEWDWQGAERGFQRALEISPGHAQIRHDYAHFLLALGRQRESAEQTREAVRLDPVNPMLISCLGWHSLFDARYDDAHRFAAEATRMMPDHWASVVLGWALLGEGKPDSALVAFRRARQLNENAFTLAALGHGLAAAGRVDEARRTLELLLERVEHEYVSPYDIATVYAGLGDADDTFKWLRRAAEERSTFIVHVGWDARFDRVRADARFADLTTRELRLPTPQFAAVTAHERRSM